MESPAWRWFSSDRVPYAWGVMGLLYSTVPRDSDCLPACELGTCVSEALGVLMSTTWVVAADFGG